MRPNAKLPNSPLAPRPFLMLFPLVYPETRDFLVAMVDRRGTATLTIVEAEGERLAALLAEELYRGLKATAVDSVPILGRCVRCEALILEGDWHRRFPAGLVCEDCPRSTI